MDSILREQIENISLAFVDSKNSWLEILKNCNNKEEALNLIEAAQSARDKNLEEREKNLIPTEEIYQIKKALTTKEEQLNSQEKQLARERSDFEVYKQTETVKLNKDKAEAAALADANRTDKAILDREWVALHKREEEYKDQILQEVKARLG